MNSLRLFYEINEKQFFFFFFNSQDLVKSIVHVKFKIFKPNVSLRLLAKIFYFFYTNKPFGQYKQQRLSLKWMSVQSTARKIKNEQSCYKLTNNVSNLKVIDTILFIYYKKKCVMKNRFQFVIDKWIEVNS